MTGHGSKYSHRWEAAIGALLQARTVEEAAKAANISAKSLFRWMKLPEFDEAYREARRATFSQAIARLQYASSAAVSTLLKVMLDPTSPSSSRVRAADSVLDHALHAIETEDMEKRISALEQSLKEPTGIG